jgi:quercetin dioxygenase-like cupin family protein
MNQQTDVAAAGLIVTPQDATVVPSPVGGPLQLMLHGDQTAGNLTVFEVEVMPGEGPPLHRHEAQDEAWRVLEGTLRFRLGDEVSTVEAGGVAFAPRGVPHCFDNIGDAPARMITIFTPAGLEPFFEGFSDLAEQSGVLEAFRELGEPCGMFVVGPPLAQSHPR